MKVLVTGGAGFIGSHVCDRLIGEGHSVVAADNLRLGTRENIAHLTDRETFEFVEIDVSAESGIESLFASNAFECVFHMAANSDIQRGRLDPAIDFSDTFMTTYSVLEAMRHHGTKQIIFASSSAIYGEARGPIREDYGPLLPISHYGASKLAAEAFLASYGENYGIRSWIARFPNVVGERSTHGAVYDFVQKLNRTPNRLDVLGDGTQIKPYLHVHDLIDAVFLAWRRMSARTNVFNVGGTTRLTVSRMADIVAEESGRKVEICYSGGDRGWVGDVPNVDFDVGKITALGWQPRLSSESAVRAAARWAFGNLQ